jgi:hypothetical protein
MRSILDAEDYRGYVIRIEVRADKAPAFRATIRNEKGAAAEEGDVLAETQDNVLEKAKEWINRILAAEKPQA